MSRRPRFKPELTRIKLNPEQAVLSCSCWIYGRVNTGAAMGYDTYGGSGSHYTCGGTKSPVWTWVNNWVANGSVEQTNAASS